MPHFVPMASTRIARSIRNKMTRIALAIAILFPLLVCMGSAEEKPSLAPENPLPAPDLNTILMQSTFRIHGPKKGISDKMSFGTAFLMGKPTPDITKQYYVLITAAHVLEDIQGENGTLALREKHNDGSYTVKLWNVKLRDKDNNLYVNHPNADVVALYVDMPEDLNVPILPITLPGDDEMFAKFEIHPGDELLCLGFPLFVSSDFGFPILRSGKIASYPIIPTKINKRILYDFRVFEGNSGGPVYFVDHDRVYGNNMHLGEIDQFVVGLVTSQIGSKVYNDQLVELAAVVPSSFIRETIDLLPATSPYK
jgi:hypothetical protein